ncbi:uncharacterized protein LOC119865820 isoform X1 [Canis lupus familiaris]|uniref:uncharacterized protein LOC119865820 isoform X1 n=1 Tax=Canis lupus familiaris TaxID=9615 RepID=UPI0018F5632D|nr:uncharacterized protein LOC119865820 isoform X1 [Canis lupus familiaris]
MTVAAASRSWGGGSCSAPLPWPQMASEPLPLSGKVSWRRAPREYTPVGPRRRALWPREACIPRGLPQPRCPPQGRHNCVSTPPHAGNRPSALRQGHGQASCPFTRWTATQWWKEQVPETRAVEGTSTVRPLSRRRAAGSQPNPVYVACAARTCRVGFESASQTREASGAEAARVRRGQRSRERQGAVHEETQFLDLSSSPPRGDSRGAPARCQSASEAQKRAYAVDEIASRLPGGDPSGRDTRPARQAALGWGLPGRGSLAGAALLLAPPSWPQFSDPLRLAPATCRRPAATAWHLGSPGWAWVLCPGAVPVAPWG